METEFALNEVAGVGGTSSQLVLPEVVCSPADPNPTALSDSASWFDILADKMAERKTKVKQALYQMGHLLIDAKKTLPGAWGKFLSDPRVGLHQREAERIMRIASQADGEILATFGISKATMLLEKLRTPEARQTFIDNHGDLTQIPERDLRKMLKPASTNKKRHKPTAAPPPATTLESLPPELGALREPCLK